MGIISKTVKIIPHGKSVKHYREKGYNVKSGQELEVKVEDLMTSSAVLIITECDYCGKQKEPIRYVDYNTQTKNGIKKCCCVDCAKFKREEVAFEKYGYRFATQVPEIKEKIQKTNLERYGSKSPSGNAEVRAKQKETLMRNYGVTNPSLSKEIQDKRKQAFIERFGVENPLLTSEIQEKVKKTNLERYGVENVFLNKEIQDKKNATLVERYGTPYPLQNAECFEKFKQTNLKKYGYEFSIQSEEVRERGKQTNLEKYGVCNPFLNEDIKEKIKQTNLERYGVEYLLSLPSFHEHSREVYMAKYGVRHHLQNPEILAKQKETFYKNGTCPTSNQQRYLHKLYGGELNRSLKMYNLDIYLPNEKINIEYDGSGHLMSVKRGGLTQKEFDRKEIIRNNIIKREGYKIMRIISRKDYLPQDTILLQMLQEARHYFSTTQHTWMTYDIDNLIMFNAEHKQGIPYNYGILRKIKDSDLNTIKDSNLSPTKETA